MIVTTCAHNYLLRYACHLSNFFTHGTNGGSTGKGRREPLGRQPRLLEKWFYRDSNFQNWMTTANSDAFTYIGCHYVDLVHFITGLLPTAISVYGIPDRFPNGQEGFLWTDARVIWTSGRAIEYSIC